MILVHLNECIGAGLPRLQSGTMGGTAHVERGSPPRCHPGPRGVWQPISPQNGLVGSAG